MATAESSPAATTGAATTARPAALPARLYRDPDVVDLEHRRIFERNWQFAAHVSRLPNPGSYLTATAGRQPVLVLRDHD
ncbi:MAG: benzoate/toluate 1,2-dioxygenase subunit alpha, partial [Thermoleophilaceae bacterium]|nr:benzoate/toluate 1,2-dioxygenase subunit alpha [Thermoleophilaceae bacterium]